MEGSAVFGIRARCRASVGRSVLHHWADPLMPLLGMVEAVGFHFLACKADWDPLGRNLHIVFSFQIFGDTLIEINERLNPLMLQKIIDSTCIVSSIKEHFFYRSQGKTLREFDRTDDKADRIMA